MDHASCGTQDILAFLLELAALAALAVWGATVGPNLVVRVLLGVGAPAVFVALWGFWLAPRAAQRLDMPWLLIAKIAVFAVAVAALAAAGHPRLAAVLGGLAALNLGLATLWGRLSLERRRTESTSVAGLVNWRSWRKPFRSRICDEISVRCSTR